MTTNNLNLPPEIHSKSRKREIVYQRKNFCFLLWKNGITQAEIARVLNIKQPSVSFHISHPAKSFAHDF